MELQGWVERSYSEGAGQGFPTSELELGKNALFAVILQTFLFVKSFDFLSFILN